MRAARWVLNTVILSSAVVASGGHRAVAQHRVVHADVAQITGPHTDVPLRVVGAGRAEEGLRADWQAQLAVVQEQIGFQYLRMHGTQVAALNAVSTGAPAMQEEVTVQGGRFARTVPLRSNDAFLFVLTPGKATAGPPPSK